MVCNPPHAGLATEGSQILDTEGSQILVNNGGQFSLSIFILFVSQVTPPTHTHTHTAITFT